MKHILIVDDDVHISNMLYEILKKENFRVSRAYSGTEALLFLSNEKPDLILLDLMLPGLSGEEIIEKIKEIPVIVISAKDDVNDKVNLLMTGACDYITKPFNTKELIARIKVQFRKNKYSKIENNLFFDDINLDKNKMTVFCGEKNVKLTKTEYAILKLLMENSSQVITKTILLERISEDTPDCVESSLKVHISNLRKKLKTISSKNYVESVWGIGYKMNEEKS